jgi:glyoxylase I family protein
LLAREPVIAHDEVGEPEADMAEDTRPGLTGIHHFSATVTDVEASAAWYQRLFGLARLPVTFPHYEREDTGYAVLLLDQRSGVVIGLHANRANERESFDECRTGLDHELIWSAA